MLLPFSSIPSFGLTTWAKPMKLGTVLQGTSLCPLHDFATGWPLVKWRNNGCVCLDPVYCCLQLYLLFLLILIFFSYRFWLNSLIGENLWPNCEGWWPVLKLDRLAICCHYSIQGNIQCFNGHNVWSDCPRNMRLVSLDSSPHIGQKSLGLLKCIWLHFLLFWIFKKHSNNISSEGDWFAWNFHWQGQRTHLIKVSYKI